MKIGLVTGEYPPMQGGVGDFTRQISLAMQDLDCHVNVVTQWRNADDRASASSPGDEVRRVVSPAWSWRDMWRVRQETIDMDLVNVQYQAAAYGTMRMPIHFLSKFLATPSVVTFHDLREPYLFPKAGLLRPRALLGLAQSAHGVIVTNSEDYQKLSGSGKIKYLAKIPIGSNIECAVPSDFDPAPWRVCHGVSEEEFLIGYFGFVNASKGVESLIRAFAELVKEGIPVRLVMIGGQSGSSDTTNVEHYKRIVELEHSLGFDRPIIRTGFVPPAEISAALLSCQVMVMPYRDGASLRRGTLMACMNHGRPTITTAPSTPSSYLKHGANSYFVPTDSPAKLAEAVKVLRNDVNQRVAIGKGARTLSDMFTWDKIASQTLEFFEQAIAT